jgi:hypothetical protein
MKDLGNKIRGGGDAEEEEEEVLPENRDAKCKHLGTNVRDG